MADVDEHCTRMYAVMTSMSLGRYVPRVAKATTAASGTDDKDGCVIYLAGLEVAWLDAPRPPYQPTQDTDETRMMMSSGNVGFFDPTGDDGTEFDGVGVVCVPQPDGTVVVVTGFERADVDVTLTLADAFDRAVATSRG